MTPGARGGRALLAAACAAVALVAPARAGGCAAVTTTGGWSVIALPGQMSAVDVAVAFGRGGHDTLYGFGINGVGNDARTLWRSRDAGCSWAPVLSLDTAGAATDLQRLDPAYRLMWVTVAQGAAARPRAIYALAGDDGYGFGVSLPVVTFVSTDDGAHWTVHQPPPAALAGDHPRCERDGIGRTRLDVGTDPSTVYLRCHVGALGEVFLMTQCADSYYVSHDAATTWTASRPPLRDLAHAYPDDGLGCAPLNAPVPSRTTPREVWEYEWRFPGPLTLVVSRDEGKTFAKAAATRAAVTCSCGFEVGQPRSGRPVVAAWDSTEVYLADAAGTLGRVPRPVPTSGTLGGLSGAAFLQDAKGRLRLLVGYHVEKPEASEAFLLDPATRRWTVVTPRPRLPNKMPAWTQYGTLLPHNAPGASTVYFATYAGLLLRYAA
jgi:hypothetical protein